MTFLNMLFSHQSGLWWKMLERAYLYIMLNGFTSQHNQHPKSPYLFTLQPRMFFMWCEARSGQRQALFESTKVECAPSRLENLESTWWGREGHRSFRAYRSIAQVSMLNSRHKKTLVPQPVVAFFSSTCLSFKVGLRLSKTGEVC